MYASILNVKSFVPSVNTTSYAPDNVEGIDLIVNPSIVTNCPCISSK